MQAIYNVFSWVPLRVSHKAWTYSRAAVGLGAGLSRLLFVVVVGASTHSMSKQLGFVERNFYGTNAGDVRVSLVIGYIFFFIAELASVCATSVMKYFRLFVRGKAVSKEVAVAAAVQHAAEHLSFVAGAVFMVAVADKDPTWVGIISVRLIGIGQAMTNILIMPFATVGLVVLGALLLAAVHKNFNVALTVIFAFLYFLTGFTLILQAFLAFLFCFFPTRSFMLRITPFVFLVHAYAALYAVVMFYVVGTVVAAVVHIQLSPHDLGYYQTLAAQYGGDGDTWYGSGKALFVAYVVMRVLGYLESSAEYIFKFLLKHRTRELAGLVREWLVVTYLRACVAERNRFVELVEQHPAIATEAVRRFVERQKTELPEMNERLAEAQKRLVERILEIYRDMVSLFEDEGGEPLLGANRAADTGPADAATGPADAAGPEAPVA